MQFGLRAFGLLVAVGFPVMSFGQGFDVRQSLAAIHSKYGEMKEYSFEGTLVVEGQRGSNPGRQLAKAKVSLAVGPEGRYRLEVDGEERDPYLLACDGQKSWAYVPKLKQYTETEGSVLLDTGEEEGESDSERDLAATFSQSVAQIFADLVKTAAQAGPAEPAQVKYGGKKSTWPTLQVVSKPDSDGAKNLTAVIFDPETLRIGRLVQAHISQDNGERTMVRMVLDFERFDANQPAPADTYTFVPPKNAKLVDAVPIPGQTGSFLLNKPAPDFELKTLEGDRIRLSDLRGKPVLLNFWASWCGPCRRELPGLLNIHRDLTSKGLVILGVNDEGRGAARKYAAEANLMFDTVDDFGKKAHKLYRVRSIPTVFLIDKDGTIVRFFSGARDEATLRAALKAIGL